MVPGGSKIKIALYVDNMNPYGNQLTQPVKPLSKRPYNFVELLGLYFNWKLSFNIV